MRSSLPADPEHDMLIIHSDDSPEDVPEPYAMRTRVQKTNSQADVTAGMCPSSLDTVVSV